MTRHPKRCDRCDDVLPIRKPLCVDCRRKAVKGGWNHYLPHTDAYRAFEQEVVE